MHQSESVKRRLEMECPYCKKDMRSGSIKANNLLSWTPGGESQKGGTLWAKSKNSIVLAKYFGLWQASVDAFYCYSCKKIIIDTNQY